MREHHERQRWGVFVWDADGDMGEAVVVGPFRSEEAADAKAEAVRRASVRDTDDVAQAIVIPIYPGPTSATDAVEAVMTSA